ncbi:MAG: LysE/ArgO family amino acid transporter [Parachlamydiales bacterium]|jgi:L-lysine exporter family protein LysE/ArgO
MGILLALIKGFSTSCGLIIAIGAQNAFVIKQGLKGEHLLLTALLCSVIDAFLITFGVVGFGQYIHDYPLFLTMTKYLAVAFLVFYGIASMRSAFKKHSLACGLEEHIQSSVKRTTVSLLALSLLNPHVYLDTVILLGSIASQQPLDEQIFFAFGAISASFVWFFTITFGARLISPLLQKSSAWRIIDSAIAFMMWGIAVTLLVH